jgi:tetratricopeptide (TPR) repeat protein
LAILLHAVPAVAGEVEEKEAHALYEAAAKDFDERRFEDAIQKLDAAFALFPIAIIVLKKSEALENLGRLAEALEVVQSIDDTDERIMGKIVAGIRRLESALAMPVDVSVTSGDVTEARILVDGTATNKTTPSVIQVSRGAHVIRVERDGYEPFETVDFIAMGGGMAHIKAALAPLQGHVVVRLSAGTFVDTRVVIDGENVAITDKEAPSSQALEIGVGEHEMICIREGYAAAQQRFSLAEQEGLVLLCDFAELEVIEATSEELAWWIGGTGGALALAGGGLIYSYFEDLEHAETIEHRLVSNKHTFGGVLLGVGVATVVTAFFLGPEEDAASGEEAVTTWSLIPADGGARFSLETRF